MKILLIGVAFDQPDRDNPSAQQAVGFKHKLADQERCYERPYCIVPDGKSGEEAFAVIRDAMKDKGRMALFALDVLALADLVPTALLVLIAG